MATDVATRVSELVEPLIKAHGADLYDVVHGGATLQVLVGGDVDLEELAVLTREISVVLDEADPMPDRYTLEVSTPGLERTLRSVEHFRASVGRRVVVKTFERLIGDSHRIEGVIADAGSGSVRVSTDGGEIDVPLDAIRSARTVFDWN